MNKFDALFFMNYVNCRGYRHNLNKKKFTKTRASRIVHTAVRDCSTIGNFWSMNSLEFVVYDSSRLQWVRIEQPVRLQNYSTRVTDVLRAQEEKGIHYGVELELEHINQDKLNIINRILSKVAIAKRDGSISQGCEIVTLPGTIQQQKEWFKPFFAAKCADMTAEPNCGIHIHVGKRHLSFLTQGRIAQFVNDPDNKARIVKIAGRESERFARFGNGTKVTTPWKAITGDKYKVHPSFDWNKYSAVNFAPRPTLEFRIFKSTTNEEEFHRFLEFTEATVNYCNLAGDDNKGKIRTLKDYLSWDNFKAYVLGRAKGYPALSKFIVKEQM